MNATSEIQIDRYSAKSADGIAVAFLDESNPHAGWKTTFNAGKSWVRFNEVDFGRGAQQTIEVRAKAPAKGALEIRLDKQDGPVVGRVEVGQGADWNITSVSAKGVPAGVHDLFITQPGAAAAAIEVDWVRFR